MRTVTTITHDGITDTWRGWATRLGVAVATLKFRARLMRRAGGIDLAKLLAPHRWAPEWRSKDSTYVAQKKRQRRRKVERRAAWIAELKKRPCADCGGVFLPCAMDFDHRDPERKLFQISRSERYSEEAVLAEIAKCDLVCANCHRIRTWRARQTTVRREYVESRAPVPVPLIGVVTEEDEPPRVYGKGRGTAAERIDLLLRISFMKRTEPEVRSEARRAAAELAGLGGCPYA